jgi:predicted  nucleic acid-binding Zn-ribbon protein
MKIKFKCLNLKGKFLPLKTKTSSSINSRQNQANELLRTQQSSIEREHELAEEFRLKISNLKQEITRIKKLYDDRLLNLNKEHKEILEKVHEEHQLEIDHIKSELKQCFDIETEAQTKFYLQTIEELKREHNDLLLKQTNEQMTKNELGEEFLQEKKFLEKQIEILQEQIEQIKSQSQFELNGQTYLFETKSNEYQQLQKEFEQYKFNVNTNSNNNMTELNEQVGNTEDNKDQF